MTRAQAELGGAGGGTQNMQGGPPSLSINGPSTKLCLIGTTLIFLFFSVLSADRNFSSRTAVCDYFDLKCNN